jgi:nickel transport protein
MKLMASFFILLSTLFAHRVNIFAYIEGHKIYTESYSSDGKPVVSGKIEIYNEMDELIHSGNTDEQGKYAFTIPLRTNLRIVLDAGMGHRAETAIKKNEIPELTKSTNKATKEQYNLDKTQGRDREISEREVIREIVDQVYEEKIEYLITRLNQRSHPIEFRDILGGLGYIFGLAGIILYFKRKKK